MLYYENVMFEVRWPHDGSSTPFSVDLQKDLQLTHPLITPISILRHPDVLKLIITMIGE